MRYAGERTSGIFDSMQSSTSSPFAVALNSKYGCSYLAISSITVSRGVIPGILPEKQDGEPDKERDRPRKSRDGNGPFQYSKNDSHAMTLSAEVQRSSIGQSRHRGLRAWHRARPWWISR